MYFLESKDTIFQVNYQTKLDTLLVEQIMAAKQENPKANQPTEEKQIDKLVYDLYRLTPTEKEIVRSSIGEGEKS